MSAAVLSLVAGLTTAVAMLLIYFLARDAAERRRLRQLGPLAAADGEEPVGILVPVAPPRNAREQIDRDFERLVAQSGTGLSAVQGLGIVALCVVLFGGFAFFLRGDLVLTMLGIAAGVALPLLVFRIYLARTRSLIQDQLPDAYFLMARSLRAGLNVEQAISTVGRHGPQPLAREFRRVGDQIELGLAVPTAVKGMARRLEMVDADVLVTAVSLHRTHGGNLALLMERVAQGARDRNQFRGYFMAATALGRITGIAIALVAPILLLGYALWQPQYLAAFTGTSNGLRMLTTATILEVVGVIWLWLVLRIDY